jgi:hypothetical protein
MRPCGNTLRDVHRRVVVLLNWAAVIALGVTACSSSGDSRVATAVVTHVRALPPGVTEPPGAFDPHNLEPFARWAQSHAIYVTTWGSGSCPRLPTSVHADGAHKVQIKTAERGGPNCTADLAPTTSTVKLPPGTADTGAIVVTIDGTATELAARSP